MANFLAYRIMYDYMTYSQVPTSLKSQVKDILIQSGCEHLVIE
ncbi:MULTISPECIES: hypothetical protein [Terrisporobacter]|nr:MULTISPECIES: hypothetical protein [Terrisporobacter]